MFPKRNRRNEGESKSQKPDRINRLLFAGTVEGKNEGSTPEPTYLYSRTFLGKVRSGAAALPLIRLLARTTGIGMQVLSANALTTVG